MENRIDDLKSYIVESGIDYNCVAEIDARRTQSADVVSQMTGETSLCLFIMFSFFAHVFVLLITLYIVTFSPQLIILSFGANCFFCGIYLMFRYFSEPPLGVHAKLFQR